MTKVLKFKVGIEGLEDKINREIEITDRRTVAELAYAILATFNSLAYHLYYIEYKNTVYDCWVCIEDDHSEVPPTNATTTKLGSIGLEKNDTMKMVYDTGSTTHFHITYLGSRDFEKGNGMHYPYITNGRGAGMLDDLCDFELKAIVEDTDKKGKSEYYYTPGYRGNHIYDYRDFNLDKNNLHVRRYFYKIKKGYEVEE